MTVEEKKKLAVARAAAWKRDNRDRYVAWNRKPENAEKNRKRARDWYRKNQDRVASRNATPRYREVARKYREKTKDFLNENRRRWRLNNLERCKQYNRIYFKTELGRSKAILNQSKRRELKKNGTLTSSEIVEFIRKSKRCAYCGVLFDLLIKPTLDHIVPLSRGGENSLFNLTIACKSCNSRKHAKSLGIKFDPFK